MTRPWETLESVATADGPLELRRRGDRDFLITIRGRVLMTSVAHRSEDALARLACNGLADKRGARVLIGGLGMAYTLRAALDALGPDARVTVAELNPAVASWCRGPLATLTDGAVNDPRSDVMIDDVSQVIARASEAPASRKFDAIVIDLYEGPQPRIAPDDPLYSVAASANVFRALRENGTYAIWCEKASPAFERSLRSAGFRVELHRGGRGGSVHLIYVAHAVPQRDRGEGPRDRRASIKR
jgi:spermidine synthase